MHELKTTCILRCVYGSRLKLSCFKTAERERKNGLGKRVVGLSVSSF